MVVGGQRARRIRAGGVAGECVRLAAAAAEVLLPARAGAAGAGHPAGATETLEGRGVVPDPGERTVADVGRVQVRQGGGGRAGQRRAVGRDGEGDRSPPSHAGFGDAVEVVGDHPDQLDAAFEPLPAAFDGVPGAGELVAAGQQRGAVEQAPAVVLGVGQFDAVDAPGLAQLDQVVDGVEVVAVQHHVEAEGEPGAADEGRGPLLGGEGGRAGGDPVVGRGIGVLDGELDAAQPRRAQRGQPRLVQAGAAGDQLGVDPGGLGGGDDPLQVGAHQRLAAGEMRVDDAQRGGLAQHVRPLLGGQFTRTACQFQRVGAVRAVQRAGVGELGEQGPGAGPVRGGHRSQPSWCRRSRKTGTSAATGAPGWRRASSPTISPTVRVPSHRPTT